MKIARLLGFYIAMMLGLVLFGLVFPNVFHNLLARPEIYLHVKTLHIVSVALLFGNTVIGTLWEIRSLFSKRLSVIRSTYETVVWLDALFTAPVVLVTVVTGITLGTTLGGIWSIGWLSVAFCIFAAAGLVWLAVDIPTQYRIRAICGNAQGDSVPLKLTRLLRLRACVNTLTIVPFFVIYALMIEKPEIPTVSALLKSYQSIGMGTGNQSTASGGKTADGSSETSNTAF